MATRHGQIVARVVELLRDAQIAGVEDRVYRDRGLTLDAATLLPIVDVQLERNDPQEVAERVTRHDLRVRVAVYARELIGQPPSEVADGVAEQVHRVLMTDRTLGGRCARLYLERESWQYRPSGDGVVVVLGQTYVAVHATRSNDLAVVAA
jgi:hypothetical protein